MRHRGVVALVKSASATRCRLRSSSPGFTPRRAGPAICLTSRDVSLLLISSTTKVRHQRIVLLRVVTDHIPRVGESRRGRRSGRQFPLAHRGFIRNRIFRARRNVEFPNTYTRHDGFSSVPVKIGAERKSVQFALSCSRPWITRCRQRNSSAVIALGGQVEVSEVEDPPIMRHRHRYPIDALPRWPTNCSLPRRDDKACARHTTNSSDILMLR